MNLTLIVAASLSAIASLLHIGIIFGGASWYRFFGAGEKFARAAEAREIYPAIVTAGIALVLALWAAFALSGAGAIVRLPYLKLALVAISTIYLLRGLAIIPLALFAREQVSPFWLWSSGICLGYGVVHVVGVYQIWGNL